MSEKYVLYTRVSTDRQEESGLGLSAQEDSMRRFLSGKDIIAVFSEAKSGGDCSREELIKAVSFCKENGAVLVVSKLDRLGRDRDFLSSIDKQIRILDIENPSGNKLVFGIKSVLAEEERNLIKQRTRDALQSKIRKEGKYVNNPTGKGIDLATIKSVESRKEAAENNTNNRKALLLIFLMMQNESIKGSYQLMAELLNDYGFRTSTGMLFNKQSVYQLWSRRYNFDFFHQLINKLKK